MPTNVFTRKKFKHSNSRPISPSILRSAWFYYFWGSDLIQNKKVYLYFQFSYSIILRLEIILVNFKFFWGAVSENRRLRPQNRFSKIKLNILRPEGHVICFFTSLNVFLDSFNIKEKRRFNCTRQQKSKFKLLIKIINVDMLKMIGIRRCLLKR